MPPLYFPSFWSASGPSLPLLTGGSPSASLAEGASAPRVTATCAVCPSFTKEMSSSVDKNRSILELDALRPVSPALPDSGEEFGGRVRVVTTDPSFDFAPPGAVVNGTPQLQYLPAPVRDAFSTQAVTESPGVPEPASIPALTRSAEAESFDGESSVDEVPPVLAGSPLQVLGGENPVFESPEDTLRREAAEARARDDDELHLQKLRDLSDVLLVRWDPGLMSGRGWIAAVVDRVASAERGVYGELPVDDCAHFALQLLVGPVAAERRKFGLAEYASFCASEEYLPRDAPPFEVWRRLCQTLDKDRDLAEVEVAFAGRRAKRDDLSGWGKSRSKGLRGPRGPRRVLVDVPKLSEYHFVGKHGKPTEGPERPARPKRSAGPKPPPGATRGEYVAWLRSKAQETDDGLQFWSQRAALSEASAAVASPQFAGSAKAEAELRAVPQPVFVVDARTLELRRRQPLADRGVLRVCGEWIQDLQELEAHRGCFKRHKPIFRALERFFGLTPALIQEDVQGTDRLISSLRALEADKAKFCAALVPSLQGQVLSDVAELCPEGLECFCGVERPHARPVQEVRPRRGLWRRVFQGAVGSVPQAPREGAPVVEPGVFGARRVSSSTRMGGVSVEVTHHVEGLQELADAVSGLLSATGSKGKLVVRFGAFLASAGLASTWLEVGLSFFQFISGIDWLWNLIEGTVGHLRLAFFRRYQTKKSEEEATPSPVAGDDGALSSLVRGIWMSAIYIAVKETCGEIFSGISLAVADFAKVLRMTALKSTAEDVVGYVKVQLGEFASRLKEAVKQRSLRPLWGPSKDPTRWAKHVGGLLRLHQCLTAASSKPGDARLAAIQEAVAADELPAGVVGPVSPHRYVELLHEYAARGREMAPFVTGGAAGPHSVLLKALDAKIGSAAAALRGAAVRLQPLGVYLQGDSQVGKSTLANLIFKSVGNMHGFSVDRSAGYPWVPDANFQDGLSSQHWWVEMDDVDQIVGEPSAGSPTFASHFLRLVNSVPYSVEAARAEEKGHIFAEPMLVTFASNFATKMVKKYSRFPEAFWRRCHVYARVEVKPEFRKVKLDEEGEPVLRKDGTPELLTELDKEKAAGHTDVWNIYVGRYVGPRSDDDKMYFDLEEPIGVGDFMRLVNERFDAHMAAQRRRLAAAEETTFHRCCGLPASSPCGCAASKKAESSEAEAVPLAEAGTRRYQSGRDEDVMEMLRRRPGFVELDFDPAEPGADDEDDGDGESWDPETDEEWSELGSFLAGMVWAWGVSLVTSIWTRARALPFRVAAAVWALHFYWKARKVFGPVARAVRAFCAKVVEVPAIFWAGAGTSVAVLAAVVLFLSRSYQARGDGVLPASWVSVPPVYGPQAPALPPRSTWTREEVLRATAASMFRIRTKAGSAWALAVSPEVMVVPTHLLLQGAEGATIDLGQGPQPWVFDLSWSEPVPSNDELTFVAARTKSTVGVLKFLFPVDDLSVAVFDEVVIGGPEELVVNGGKRAKDGKGRQMITVPVRTKEGDCGRPYVVRVGTSWWVAAAHYQLLDIAGLGLSCQAEGGRITQREALLAMGRLAPMVRPPAGVRTLQCLHADETGAPWRLRALGPREYSEATTAIKNDRGANLAFLGHIENRPHGATPQSRLRRTKYADLFADLEAEVCGVCPYWGAPEFAGKMVNGVWESPFQTAYAASPRVVPPRDLVMVALMDYLSSVEHLNWEDVRELSLHEAIVGVPSLWQNPVNPKTSMGLPWGGPKWRYIARNHSEVHVDPRVKEALDEFWSCLEDGEVPLFPGRMTLKDEPRKPGGAARVFTVIPAVVNISLKRVYGGLLAVLRANPGFFECWIGIDMTSQDVERLVAHLRAVCPRLNRITDADVSKMDKGWNPMMRLAVRMFWSALAFHARLDRGRVEACEMASSFVRYEWKGDIQESPAAPSGIQKIIEDNSVYQSLVARIVYYSRKPEVVAQVDWRGWVDRFAEDPRVPDSPLFSFRRDHALANFGDDQIMSDAEGVRSLLDPAVYRLLVGQEVTNGRKTADLSSGPLSTATFLKRTLHFDAELGYHLARLDKKSIVKTCVVQMPSTLSDVDHAAVTLTQAMREAALHGEEFYERVRSLSLAAAKREGFSDHAFFKPHPYAVLRRRMLEGAFSVYQDPLEDGTSAGPVADLVGLINLGNFQQQCNVVFN